MGRLLHFVGTLPRDVELSDDRSVLMWPVEHAKGHRLRSVPRDLDRDWIIRYLRERAEQPEVFDIALPGDYDGYDDLRAYRVRPGARLLPAHVATGRVARIRDIAGTYRELRADCPELHGVRLQISQPSPLDTCLFVEAGGLAVTSGMPWERLLAHPLVIARALRHLPVYTAAVVAEVDELTRDCGDMLSWQIESPLATLAMVRADGVPGLSGPVGRLLARHLARVFDWLSGIGAACTLHLCYGDYQHQPLLVPNSLAPVVRLLNRLGRRLDRLRAPRPAAHIPCAYGPDRASVEPAFYQPLRRLDRGWRELIAGVAATDHDASCVALSLFERAAGRQALAVAAACGLGRQHTEDAELVVKAMSAAADIPHPSVTGLS